MRKTALFLLLFLAFCNVAFSQNMDIDLLKYINLQRNVSTDLFFTVITDSAALLCYVIPVVMFIIAFFKKNLLLNNMALYLSVSVLSSMLITTLLKHLINRKRPFATYSFIQKIGEGGSPSFPSGHTTDAFALATSVSLLYPKWYVIVLSYLWATLIAYSRIDLGVHYPSDVLAGAIVGSAVPYLCHRIFQRQAVKNNN